VADRIVREGGCPRFGVGTWGWGCCFLSLHNAATPLRSSCTTPNWRAARNEQMPLLMTRAQRGQSPNTSTDIIERRRVP
jgi:hypothetical protein